MKKIFAILLACALAFIPCTAAFAAQQSDIDALRGTKLYVYNWGEYISDGADDTLDINAEFEKAGVKDIEASKAEFIADGRMPAVRESIRRSKAVDHLVENAKVTVKDEVAERAAEAEAARQAAEAANPAAAADEKVGRMSLDELLNDIHNM